MERPTKKVELPISGMTAEVVTYFTRGESKQIEARQNEGVKTKFVGGEPVMEELPANYVQRRFDAMLEIGVKKLVAGNNKEVEVNEENLNSLPDRDAKVLINELSKSHADVETKKK